jgi:sugar phosphate isomerase/epimerase
MGLASTSFMTVRRPNETLQFLEYCASLGAGGIQASLSSLEPAYLKRLRARAEELGMYLEVMAPLPAADAARFEAIITAAKEVGARCLRVACLGGRRYETFSNRPDWDAFVARSRAGIAQAAALAARHRLPVAIENHKDWTLEELAPLMREFGGEFLGLCLDTGNNIALLDEAHEFVDALARYAISSHLKDMAVAEYPQGFLLAEVPLGEGALDIPRLVRALRAARPEAPITLEMITRNPLEVPCHTEKYWVTMPSRPAALLARTMAWVKRVGRPLPRLDALPPAARARWEEDNVKHSLAYARQQLNL